MARLTVRNALTWHWPEFLIEGRALGMFMIRARACSRSCSSRALRR